MALETIQLEHLPSTHKVHVAFFRNVENASFLQQQLLDRNTDFEYAFVDASVVVSRFQLLSAVFKAVTNAIGDALKTSNVHSETVLSLSSSKNIAEAYRRYGITATTKDLLVVKVTFPTDAKPEVPSADQVWEHLQANVMGEAVPVTDDNIAAANDLAKLRKYYKLNGLNWLDSIKDEKLKRKEMETLIVGSMALRGV